MSIKNKWSNIRNRVKYGNNWYGPTGQRRKIVKLLRGKQNGNCAICMLPMAGKDTVDHIKEMSEGGKHEIYNMQLLCQSCHSIKDKENQTKFGTLGSQIKVKKFGYKYKPGIIKNLTN